MKLHIDSETCVGCGLCVGSYPDTFAFDDEVEETYGEKDGFARTFIYEVIQEFDFTWNNRGWWVCTENEITDYSLLSVEYTPYLE